MGAVVSLHQPDVWHNNSAIGKDGRRRLSVVRPTGATAPGESVTEDRLPPLLRTASRRVSQLMSLPENPPSTTGLKRAVSGNSTGSDFGDVSEDDRDPLSPVRANEPVRVTSKQEEFTMSKTLSKPRRTSMQAVISTFGSFSSMLVQPVGDQNELSLVGIAALSTASAYGCYALRLTFRDLLADFRPFTNLTPAKKLVVELYMLGTIHATAWAFFALRKIFKGQWDDDSGTTRAIGLSSGYYLHEFISVRSLFTKDPLRLFHNLTQIIMHVSMLRSSGSEWMAPTTMIHVIPNVPLNLWRILRVMGAHPGATITRLLMALYASAFVLTNTICVPSVCAYNWVVKPKAELHQPSYLPVKICLAASIATFHFWFKESLIGAREVLKFESAGGDLSLEALRDEGLRRIGTTIGAMQLVGLLGMYVAGPALLPVIFLAARRGMRRSAFALIGVLAALTISPLSKEPQPWFIRSAIVQSAIRKMAQYFGFKVVQEAPLQKDRRYLCALYPHGFFPLGMQFLVQKWSEDGFLPAVAGASVLFQLPVLRQALSWAGGIPATKKRIMECLRKEHPYNITFITPGGIAEMFNVKRPDVEHILTERKGFIRCAVEAGADIVPVYVVGHTQMYQVVGGIIGRMCEAFSRWARVSILAFHGRGGTPVPYPTPTIAFVGRPIPTGEPMAPTAEGFKKHIDELHQQFLQELEALFHRHKHLAPGYEDKQLYLGADAELPPPPVDDLEEYTRSKL